MSPIASTKAKSSRSSRSSNLKETKKNVELKKLMDEQAVELAQYEAEMEKTKIDIEMQKAKMAREIRFKAQLAEKEYDLLSLGDGDSASNEDNSVVKNKVDHTFPLEPQLPKQEQRANRIANCHKETTKAAEFAPCLGTNSTQAVLLRVPTLQAMQPVKFNGNAADFPVFRRRISDNLEDGLLSDAQKIEFLPKFVSGEVWWHNQQGSNNRKVWSAIPSAKRADPSLDVSLEELPVAWSKMPYRVRHVWFQGRRP